MVHNFCKRGTANVGFEVDIEFDGVVHKLSHPKAVGTDVRVKAAEITYDSASKTFTLNPLIESSQTVKQTWGVSTQSFQKVSTVMLSPNYWDEKAVGNKHYFFMLEGCKNEDTARGFFNEFLSAELDPHRKVLEMVGSKMKTEESEDQLSGLGFSSTQRNEIICRVTGKFSRVVKIKF